MIIPVVLSGGAGTRLWPLSRELHPKQLLPLVGSHTMLQNTLLRLDGLVEVGPPVVVCNESHRFMVAEQLQSIGCRPTIILEPVGRNTAPAAAVAALTAMEEGGDDPILLVLPADHDIHDPDRLRRTITAASAWAAAGSLVIFGVVPLAPETGYGYIKAGPRKQPLEYGPPGEDCPCFSVEAFVEKPSRSKAVRFLESGGYFWNSGMFMFRASRFIQELERFQPDMVAACRNAVLGQEKDVDFLRLDRDAFQLSPADSIDYAVMEKTSDAVMVPLDVGWNDVGSWSAMLEVVEPDGNGNCLLGDVLARSTRDCYLRSESRLVAAVGVHDLIVVETADAVLVASKEEGQNVKAIVQDLKESRREEAVVHRRVSRPWGAYETIDRADRFQVKRITVNPGAGLSLQKHHHRAEHWVVVRGTARITRGDEVIALTENQSIYIPIGTVHRLENPGRIPLELIEVQSGSYLGEDDIVRLEDDFGRS